MYSGKLANGFNAFAGIGTFGFVKPAHLRHVWAAAIAWHGYRCDMALRALKSSVRDGSQVWHNRPACD